MEAKRRSPFNGIPGYASPEEGLKALLEAEGGCVGLSEACGLFRKPNPFTSQALIAKIRKRAVIAYRAPGGQYLVPVWQLCADGGLLQGLPKALSALRATVPSYDQLSPFTFLLQADPIMDGMTPLAALRAWEIQKVFTAIDGCFR